MPQPPADLLQKLRDGLRARRTEFEQSTLVRIAAISDPADVPDPSYLAGLRNAVAAALEYGLAALVEPEREPPPVPLELLAQARRAARNEVSLDAVLRRYAAGHGLLADGLLEEAAAAGAAAADLKPALRALALRYDRIVAVVSEEYERESTAGLGTRESRSQALIRGLLAGEPLDAGHLDYRLDGHHLAIVASGDQVPDVLPGLGKRFDRRLLLDQPEPHITWIWLGGRRPFDCDELDLLTSYPWPDGSALACGEPGAGLSGWRLSHRQAAAAFPIAQRAASLVHYADVALVTAVLKDDLLAASLRQAYLDPLAAERQAGATAKETLRAYFEAARNISSAAALLGVNRSTVTSRLAAVEERLGSSLDAIATELELALRLDELDQPADS